MWKRFDHLFDQFSTRLVGVFSHSLTFLAALTLVIFWLSNRDWQSLRFTDSVRDIILSITFLSFFVIQKSFKRFSQVLHLKLNELIVTQENARNNLVKAEEKPLEKVQQLEQEHLKMIEKEQDEKDDDK